ncbi:unnamed protein product, partial [Musa acuminata subsp. malaccensis]
LRNTNIEVGGPHCMQEATIPTVTPLDNSRQRISRLSHR